MINGYLHDHIGSWETKLLLQQRMSLFYTNHNCFLEQVIFIIYVGWFETKKTIKNVICQIAYSDIFIFRISIRIQPNRFHSWYFSVVILRCYTQINVTYYNFSLGLTQTHYFSQSMICNSITNKLSLHFNQTIQFEDSVK